MGDAGNLRVGDALFADPDPWSAIGHLVGVDGGLGAATACAQSSDCTLAPVSCACYALERTEVQALNVAYADNWAGPWCTRRCEFNMNPWLVPSCVAATCTVVDIQQHLPPGVQRYALVRCAFVRGSGWSLYGHVSGDAAVTCPE